MSARRLDSYPLALLEGIGVRAFPDMESFYACIIESIRLPHQTIIPHVNVHGFNIAAREPRYKRFLQAADFVYCDGAGVIWGSKLAGTHPLPRRFPAADFLFGLLEALAEAGHSAFLLGWKPEILEAGLEQIEASVKGHSIVGHHHGYIHKDPALHGQVLEQIRRCAPDIVLVGFGMPLQEYWIEEHGGGLPVRTFFPVGAVLDYISGSVARAPLWMRQRDLEWLWRFGLEPRRMFHRYIIGNPAFLGRVLIQRLRERG